MASIDQLKQALINADKAGDTAAAQKLAQAIRAQQQAALAATAPAATAPAEEPSSLDKIGDFFTGNLRETEQTQTLPDWTEMPELNDVFSKAGWKTALGTLMSGTDEAVQVIKANYPGVQVAQDEKGNYLLTSQNGQTYALKPGFRVGDIPRAGAALAAFTPAGRAGSILGAGAASAGTQAVIEGTQAVSGGEFNPADVALSGITGAALPAVVGGVKRLIGAARGGAAAVQTPAQQTVQQIESQGIRAATTDVIPPRTFIGKSAQAMGERIPLVGTGGMRKEQMGQRIQAVRSLLDDYGAIGASKASDDVMADLLKTRGERLTKYSTQKKEVIDRLSSMGRVPVNNTLNAIDNEIAALSKNSGTKEIDAVIADLTALRQNAVGKDLGALEQQRVILGERYKAPEMATIRGIAEKSLSKIYGPLRQDMADFIQSNGQRRDYTKWMVANKQLAGMAGELESGALKSVLRRGDATPEVVSQMLFSAKPSEVRALVAQLSPAGRDNAKMAILNRVAEKSIVDTAEGTALSPEKFVSQIKKLSSPIGVAFTKDELARINGLVRAIEITNRAGKSGVMTMTGQEAVPYVAGAGLTSIFGGATGAVGAAATVGGMARAYESRAVRDLLLRLNAVPRGSGREAALANQVIQAVSQFKEEK